MDWKVKVDLFEQLRQEHEFGEGLIGAGRHERTAERATYRNGYRDLNRARFVGGWFH